ncbi:amino acid transporter [Arachidicoccus ginsenosidimutans]|uniref:APC family permease n=1 Tax=Arachidicoccus sp. BS20 TaxID=1850526 RepID=UPI0007F16DAF|nr:amino acid permease [Arachidicoccus sp. BS20]ANI89096.1 amino acid transporter [Arachidicoccus sp. BS20]
MSASFKRSVSLLDAVMVVAGAMIGSGIFIVSADMIRNVGSSGWLILLWIVTGIITIIGALSYGELSGMFPTAGGQYMYLREAYNRRIGFLYGWSFFMVIQTGTIAAVAVAFSKFTAYLLPVFKEENMVLHFGNFNVSAGQLLAIVIVILLTAINSLGIKYGKTIQTIFTLAKLLSLIGLIVLGIWLGANKTVWISNWHDAFNFQKLSSNGFSSYTSMAFIGAFAAAMVGSLFSSDAWHSIAFIAGEVKKPERNIGLSLLLGTLIVTVLYVAVNLVYLAVLPLHDIAFAPNDRIAVAAMDKIWGNSGTIIMAALIMISTFGCVNGLVLTGARVYYSMAKDGLFFQRAGHLNRAGVPSFGLWIQCIWACVLCLSGHYGDLLDYVIFVVLIFYVLTIIGVFRLRKNKPDLPRPYKAFGYPVLPAIYIVVASVICIALLFTKPRYTWFGLIIVLLGLPVYYLAEKKGKRSLANAENSN